MFYHMMKFLMDNFEVDQCDFLNQSHTRLSHYKIFRPAKVNQKFERPVYRVQLYCQKLIILIENSDSYKNDLFSNKFVVEFYFGTRDF